MKTVEHSVYIVVNEASIFIDVFKTAALARRYCKDNDSGYSYSRVTVKNYQPK